MANWKKESGFKTFVNPQGGFSLLEALLALFVLSLSLTLISSFVNSLNHLPARLDHSKQVEWHIFLHQLPHEVDGYYLAYASHRGATFKTDHPHNHSSSVIDITYRHRSLIRRVNYRGFQPLLTDIQSMHFQQLADQLLAIQVTFTNGENYQAVVRIPTPPPAEITAKRRDESER